MEATREERRERRDMLDRFIATGRHYMTPAQTAGVRFGGDSDRWGTTVPVRIADTGTFRGIPAQAWTDTGKGIVWVREGIFEGVPVTGDLHAYATRVIDYVLDAFRYGQAIDVKSLVGRATMYGAIDSADREVLHRVATTAVAAFGVTGHEFLHAAISEHAMRDAWQMTLEDLRIEAHWMATDPIRARQALRACAAHWVAANASPMTGAPKIDLHNLRTKADALSLYLLIVGRARVGVLDENSTLVRGISTVVQEILGWATCSDADDIIDQFLETSIDPLDEEGNDERRRLAAEMRDLLGEDAGNPTGGHGCHITEDTDAEVDKGQKAEGDPSEGEPGARESEPGDGESGEDGDEADGEGAEPGAGTGESGDSTEGEGRGKSDAGGDEADGEGEDGGAGGEEGDEPGSADDSEPGEGSKSGTGDASGEEWDGFTIGTATGAEDSSGDEGEASESPDWVTGEIGGVINKQVNEEDMQTDELDESDSRFLSEEQVEALAEVLSGGLTEISDPDAAPEDSWGMSEKEVDMFTLRGLITAKDAARQIFGTDAQRAAARRTKQAFTPYRPDED
jgi:hypothetical protein